MPPTLKGRAIVAVVLLCFSTARSQSYCMPPFCKEQQAVVGKYTVAASDASVCYDWFFKYLNNVIPGIQNKGKGYIDTTSVSGQTIKESYDYSKTDILAMEGNECGLSASAVLNATRQMTKEAGALVQKGQRLATGEVNQCPCAIQGRAHIIHATHARKHLRGVPRGDVPSQLSHIFSQAEADFVMSGGMNNVFGLHAVSCAFHSSGPCSMKQIEQGVARAWEGNFSEGYVPLMDNNLMLWTQTLGPLIDLFQREGVEFYPMRWTAPTATGAREVFSIVASPCGKVLFELASADPGGRPPEHFHQMSMARAVFKEWNDPAGLPLVPLRVSRAVTPELLDQVLEFYGATGQPDAVQRGFHTTVLLNETGADGRRAITLKMSGSAAVHMQIWASHETDEPEPWAPNPNGGFSQDFKAAVGMNQVTGTGLEPSQGFCAKGTWSVARYTWYMLQTHKATMAPVPANTSTMSPPVGNAMNLFLDDHISWDCTAPECDSAVGGRALYNANSRITWDDFNGLWWPYSYDPAGYGIQLHWYGVHKDFQPSGNRPLTCFHPQADGTCPGSEDRSSSPENLCQGCF